MLFWFIMQSLYDFFRILNGFISHLDGNLTAILVAKWLEQQTNSLGSARALWSFCSALAQLTEWFCVVNKNIYSQEGLSSLVLDPFPQLITQLSNVTTQRFNRKK